jgi:hypothetical protein
MCLVPYVRDATALPALIAAGTVLYSILIVVPMPQRSIHIVGQLRGRLMTAAGGRS